MLYHNTSFYSSIFVFCFVDVLIDDQKISDHLEIYYNLSIWDILKRNSWIKKKKKKPWLLLKKNWKSDKKMTYTPYKWVANIYITFHCLTILLFALFLERQPYSQRVTLWLKFTWRNAAKKLHLCCLHVVVVSEKCQRPSNFVICLGLRQTTDDLGRLQWEPKCWLLVVFKLNVKSRYLVK